MSFFGEIAKSFSPDLPSNLDDMNAHLEFILPKVVPYGEDLRETNFWIGKRWLEVRDEEGFHEAILHVFYEGGEYMLSIDGNLMKGTWKQLGEYNSLVLEISGKGELFDVRFMNRDFMVLTKHGDQGRKGQRKYFTMVHEPVAKHQGGYLDWRNVMEKLYNVWRENSISIWAWLFFLILIGAIVYAST
ncbi:MAG: hypothetical protein R3A50_08260 [Saprospiraceae bacterium]|nr:hypothetical protein [Saprospiraceae bacterium]MCB9344403.1 hypothetical protein [Lewinellaceae bacterium]